jgi:hypothetical protein
MSNAKIDFTIGGISFSGEGEESWLANQLDKIIDKAPSLIKIAPVSSATKEEQEGTSAPTEDSAAIAKLTLPNFLRQKNATSSQKQRFLATAVWLHAKGNPRLATGDIVKATRDSNQSRFGNPSDVLSKLIADGSCEKDGKQFFVTEHGKVSL